MSVVETVKLIMADIVDNSNKYWTAQLMGDGSIHAEWGRVGGGTQSQIYPASRGGKRFFDKKVKEKEKKGYRAARVVGAAQGTVSKVAKTDLHQIAKSQIQTSGNAIVDKLVERLVKENIHNIEGATSITFNKDTGLFQTPLGVVEPDALDEARQILAKIAPLVIKKDWRSPKLLEFCNEYLFIIPSDIGMKRFDPSLFFSKGQESVTKQLDILDALKSSYDAMQKAPDVVDDKKVDAPKVFDLSLGLVESGSEFDKLSNLFEKNKKSMHGYDNIHVRNIFKVDANHNDGFEDSVGNLQIVFHGSPSSNSLSILKSGIKTTPPSTASIAGKLFGCGVYGSQTSTKALGYALGSRWRGGRAEGSFAHVYILEFVMGKAYYPNTYGISKIPSGYDSCWALPDKTGLHNDELIVYRNTQVRMKYLLECK